MSKRLFFIALLFGLLGLMGACQTSPTGPSSGSTKTIVVYRPAT
jgi:hypothetical protein